jgi:lipopolysaccharide export system permease protein
MFPSKTLTWYLARMFAARILAALFLIVVVIQLLDLLGESGKILAYPGNTDAQVWEYVSLRLPQLVSRFFPFAVLGATILTLGTLNQNSEVISMKAAGLSPHKVLAPLVLTAGVVALLSFAFNERVVVRSNATLKAWQGVKYGPLPKGTRPRSNIYLRDGANILQATTMTGGGTGIVMQNLSWYRRDADGMVLEQVTSPRATWANPGWRLENPVSFVVQSAETTTAPSLVVARDVGPEQIAQGSIDADGQTLFELSDTIRKMKQAGRRTWELEGKWWHKFSAPLSATLMPLLGALAAFGLARSGQLLIRGVIATALGFGYFVIDNAALAMGNFGAYPPLVAAWAPFFLFALIGETVLVRTEE